MTLPTDYIGLGHQLITDYRAVVAHLDETGRPGPRMVLALPDRASLRAVGPAPTALDLLGCLLNDLVDLFGQPVAGSPFSLTFAGPERHDGEAGYTWVVNADSLDEARRTLAGLPDFQDWYSDMKGSDEEDPDVVFVTDPYQTNAGIPLYGNYTDLRREQARIAAEGGHGARSRDAGGDEAVTAHQLLAIPAG